MKEQPPFMMSLRPVTIVQYVYVCVCCCNHPRHLNIASYSQIIYHFQMKVHFFPFSLSLFIHLYHKTWYLTTLYCASSQIYIHARISNNIILYTEESHDVILYIKYIFYYFIHNNKENKCKRDHGPF